MAGVGFRVGISVGVNGLGHGGTGPGPSGLRSLPAKQHAPKARPHPATDRGRHGRVPSQAVKDEWAHRASLRGWRGAGHSPLTAGQFAPASTTSLPASLVAGTPGGDIRLVDCARHAARLGSVPGASAGWLGDILPP